MKRIISVILTILLLALSAFALAACGGVGNNDKWNAAIEKFKTADTITLKIKDDNLNMGVLVDRDHLVSKGEIAFDATQGLVYISMQTRHGTGFIDMDPTRATEEWYYAIDGTTVNSYYRHSSQYSEGEWEGEKIMTFTTRDEAVAFLRDKYVNPVDVRGDSFPTFYELQRHGNETSTSNPRETKMNLFKTKYTQKFVGDNNEETTYVLKFLSGRLTKFSYKIRYSSLESPRKFSMTVKYNANITLPEDLPIAK